MASHLLSLFSGLECCAGGRGTLTNGPGCQDNEVVTELCPALGSAEDPRLQAVVEAAEDLLPGRKMTQWQREWCTAKTVAIYLHGRRGNIAAAGEILAQALQWRLEYKDILSGARQPEWQSDCRIIARCMTGQPVIYLCYRNHLPPSNIRAIVEHGACVLEAAVRSMVGSATQFDVVVDIHGFNVSHLDARALFPVLKMIQQPFRDRLRSAILVDAPWAFNTIWRLAQNMITETTRNKVLFASTEEAVRHMARLGGEEAGEKLRGVMAGNRIGRGCVPGVVPGRRMPSELPPAGDLVQRELRPSTGAAAAAPPPPPCEAVAASAGDAAKPSGGARRALCCRRRRPGQSFCAAPHKAGAAATVLGEAVRRMRALASVALTFTSG